MSNTPRPGDGHPAGRRTLDVRVLTHVPFEGPESIAEWFVSRAHRVTVVPVYRNADLTALLSADVVVVMGGPMGVHDGQRYSWMDNEIRTIGRVLERGIPMLGVCLGAQMIAAASGATVYRNRSKEIGWWPIEFTDGLRLLLPPGRAAGALPSARLTVFHWHGETFTLPAGATQIARSTVCEQQAFIIGHRVIGVQFHLESTPASVGSLAAAVGDEIGHGTYEPSWRPAGPAGQLADHAKRYAGACRPLLWAILQKLEDAAFA
jgi:GMP synthase-like glutamine amidotransferase